MCHQRGGFAEVNLDASGRKRAERAVILEQKRRDVLLKLHELMNASRHELFAFMIDAVREATESEYSFIGTIEENESVMVIYSWSKNTMEQCAMGDKPLRYPIKDAGLWGDCIRQRRPLIINNYAEDLPSKRGLPAGHVPVRRFMAVPVFDGNTIVAVAAVANKSEDYDRSDVASVSALTGRMWEMLRRKHAEERLQKSEAMYRQLIGLAADAIFLLSPDGRVLMANNKCSQLLGYSLEELLGMNIVDTYCEEEKEIGRQRVSAVAAGASLMFERRLRKKDGSVLLVEVNAGRLPDGNIQSIVRDITSRKRAETELNQSASLLETVFDATPIGICVMRDRRYRRVNRFWCERFGYSEQEVLGETTLQLYESKEEYERVGFALYKQCENQSVSAVQTRLRCKDGTIRDVLLTAARLQSADQPGDFVVAIEDITERKRVADALIESEKLFRAVATASP
ncbi:MAG: PAS domain S-box protein, partial [Candidatus Omnitrophica bacterium]|nr:PAS domain S-box protein [Candidatus Omnitrophota bacterium]